MLEKISQLLSRQSHCIRGLVLAGMIVVSPHTAIAQRIPIADDTLGNDRSIVSPEQVINGLPSNAIAGGVRRGANLFHSFREFNIDTGRSIYFTNPAGVANILTRVTGSNRSEILGRLGVLGNANLFLLNPNGILFGPNAQLDIRGSFLASTASSFKFPDGSEFSATNSQTPPLLTVNVAPGLQYGLIAATIRNQGTLAAGQDLTLAASNLDLQGQLQAGRDLTLLATNTVTVQDSTMVPFVAAAGRNLVVQGNQGIDIAALSHPNSGLASGGDLVLRSDNTVGGDAHFWSGGSFRIERLNGSLGDLFSPHDPIIRTTGDVRFNSYEGASLHILAGGSVTVEGDIKIISVAPSTQSLKEEVTLSDGKTKVSIDGANKVTVDIRAGVDSRAIGNPFQTGAGGFTPPLQPPPSVTSSSIPTSANITINNINATKSLVGDPPGEVLLTNQYFPNRALPGGSIKLESRIDSLGGNIFIDSRQDLIIGNRDVPNLGLNVSIGNDNGGSITLLSGRDIVSNGEITSASNEPISGDITLHAVRNISINQRIQTVVFDTRGSQSSAPGRAGNIEITSDTGYIKVDTSQIKIDRDTGILNSAVDDLRTRPHSPNSAGNVILKAYGDIEFLQNSRFKVVSSEVGQIGYEKGSGKAGAISLISDTGMIIAPLGVFNSEGGPKGTSANITFKAAEDIYTGNITSSSKSNLPGGNITVTSNAGSIFLSEGQITSTSASTNSQNSNAIRVEASTGSVKLTDQKIDTTNSSSGLAGSIFINARDQVSIQSNSTVSSEGNKGQISIGTVLNPDGISATQSLLSSFKLDSSIITTSNFDDPNNLNGTAGDITITVPSSSTSSGSVTFTNGTVTSNTSSTGNAGNIFLNAPTINITANSQIQAKTNPGSSGTGGNITVTAPTAVNLTRENNISPVISVETSGAGKAGEITINTPSLTLSDAAQITAKATKEASKKSSGGNITLNASTIDLNGGTVGVFADTDGQAPAGTLNLKPYNDQSELTIVFASGLTNSTPAISASTSSNGRGGDLIVTAPQSIAIAGPGRLAVETSSIGNAGNIVFTTGQLTLKDGVEVSASTSGSGRAGEITLNAETLALSGGAKISTNTSSSGQAGDLTLNLKDRLTLTGNGTGLFASTTFGSTGNGGSIQIDPDRVLIQDEAAIAVNSQGSGTGGNIFLQANRLELQDQGSITAETAGAQGGNITLDVRDLLLLRRSSLISATAGTAQAGGDGGNIAINSQFIVALPTENSDISANAFTGKGGKVNITAQGIFGIQFRPQPTPLSDITASSTFGLAGVVAINTPNVDPNRGLVQLPVDLTDASRLIVQTCPTGDGIAKQPNEFIITGRGGLPPTPREAVNRDAIQVDLATAETDDRPSISQNPPSPTSPSPHLPNAPIVEAQGWQIALDGTVYLVAMNPPNAIAPWFDRLIHCH